MRFILILLTLMLIRALTIVAHAAPNIIAIVADDLGAGEVGPVARGGIPTPNIDALARRGMTLINGYAQPICGPDRATLLTGRYPQRFGFEWNEAFEGDPRYGIPVTEMTIAQVLKSRGYRTGFVGKWHVGFRADQMPLVRGFDEAPLWFKSSAHDYFLDDGLYRESTPTTEAAYLTTAFGREAAAFIRRQTGPFFLYMPFNAVHLPLEAEPAMLANFSYITDPKRRTFAAMLASLDDAVGQIVAAAPPDTLIVFVGDNGCITTKSTCSNGGLRGAKFTYYEGGTRVPFLVSWPGKLPQGRTYRQPAMAFDLFATFVAAAGGTPAANLDGVDLLPYLLGATGAPHACLFWGSKSAGSARCGRWKLHIGSGETQLYDLSTDPRESINLATVNPTVVADLTRKRRAWAAQMLPAAW